MKLSNDGSAAKEESVAIKRNEKTISDQKPGALFGRSFTSTCFVKMTALNKPKNTF